MKQLTWILCCECMVGRQMSIFIVSCWIVWMDVVGALEVAGDVGWGSTWWSSIKFAWGNHTVCIELRWAWKTPNVGKNDHGMSWQSILNWENLKIFHRKSEHQKPPWCLTLREASQTEHPKERTLPGMGGAAPCTASALFLVRHLTWEMDGNGSWGRTQKKLGFDTKNDRFLINKNVM